MATPFRSYRSDKSGSAATRLVEWHIRKVMLQVASNPPMLAEIIGNGYKDWEDKVRAAFAPYPLGDEIPRQMFRYFSLRLVREFGPPDVKNIDVKQLATEVLDGLEFIAPPEDKWVLEDTSSQSYRREYMELMGMSPEEHFAKLLAEDADKAKADGRPH